MLFFVVNGRDLIELARLGAVKLGNAANLRNGDRIKFFKAVLFPRHNQCCK